MFLIFQYWSTVCVFIHIITAKEVGEKCQPNEQLLDGFCSRIADCPEAISQIRSQRHHSFQRCGFLGTDEIVCCPTTGARFGSTTQRNGDTRNEPTSGQRIADIECKKIINSSLPPLDLHIIGGERASRGEFPHMVALGFDRQNGYEFDCGGSLLSTRYVLTAAHCVDTLDKIEPTIARLGVIELGGDQFDSETDIRIERIIKHPDYIRREKYDDLALLKLSKPVEFTSYLAPVCLYTSADDPAGPLTVTGWGTTSTTKDARSHVLLKANVTVVGRERCGESYTNWRKLPQGIARTQLCAGDPDGARDTCQGDSGGPLQGLTSPDGFYRLIGVTSFGRGCGSAVPGVYTKLALYLDWIESVVWPH